MKKRILAFFLLTFVALPLLLCGCNDGSSDGAPNDTSGDTDDGTSPSETVFTFKTTLPQKVLYPLSVGGKTYYVSSDGNSSNDGLSESNPITLADVANLDLHGGDSVLFKKGDTFTGDIVINSKSGDNGNPITFASYGEGDKKPHINSKEKNAITFNKCSNIVIRDLEVSVDGKDHTEGTSALNCILFQYSFVGEEKFENIYVVNNDIHSIGTEQNVMGITVSSIEKDSKVSPLEVVKNVYILENSVYNLGRSGIHASGWLTEEELNHNNTLMTLYRNIFMDGNDVHDVGNIGIYIGACTDGSINRNLVYRTGMRRASENAEGECGIMVIGCDSVDIMYNICYDNRRAGTEWDAMGIDIDWNTTNINVQYNYCYENEGSGIGTMACQNSYIRNNRVENNKCITNQFGQIQVCDFTSRYACVAEDMHAVKNLTIADNLIIGTPNKTYMLSVKHSNGDTNYENNVFMGNHVVYTGDKVKEIRWAVVEEGLSWYKFAENKYYSSDISSFRCVDHTPLENTDIAGSVTFYSPTTSSFETWCKREPTATYELISDLAPSAPSNVKVNYAGGSLAIEWDASFDDVWHYNIYAVDEGEDVSYLNMLGETENTSFSYEPQYKGEFYIVIQPESNTGVYGTDVKVKIVLQ